MKLPAVFISLAGFAILQTSCGQKQTASRDKQVTNSSSKAGSDIHADSSDAAGDPSSPNKSDSKNSTKTAITTEPNTETAAQTGTSTSASLGVDLGPINGSRTAIVPQATLRHITRNDVKNPQNIQIAFTSPALTQTYKFTYDGSSRLMSVTSFENGNKVKTASYTYSAAGRVIRADTVPADSRYAPTFATYDYNSDGLLSKWVHDGTVVEYNYNSDHRLVQKKEYPVNDMAKVSVTIWDWTANTETIKPAVGADLTTAYEYLLQSTYGSMVPRVSDDPADVIPRITGIGMKDAQGNSGCTKTGSTLDCTTTDAKGVLTHTIEDLVAIEMPGGWIEEAALTLSSSQGGTSTTHFSTSTQFNLQGMKLKAVDGTNGSVLDLWTYDDTGVNPLSETQASLTAKTTYVY